MQGGKFHTDVLRELLLSYADVVLRVTPGGIGNALIRKQASEISLVLTIS